MKRMLAFALMLCLMLSLAACGQKDSGKQETAGQDQTTVEEQANQPADNDAEAQEEGADAAQEEQTIEGVVNKVDDYLVLLDNDGEYRIFDFDAELDPSKLAEGDQVTVTYTGELGSEDPAPVAILIQKNG